MALIVAQSLKESQARMFAWAERTNVDATYERFNHLVIVHFEHDRGFHLYDNAFAVDDPEAPTEYCWVLTEHQGCHAYSKDELSAVIELTEVSRLSVTP